MNRHAAVLAADSATTVSSWTGSSRETRYFKGANKIHQLSDSRPIGMMIFDSADLLNVPWEVVVKAFRAELKDKSLNSVEDYAKEFFDFLEKDKRLFPDDVQKEELSRAVRLIALQMSFDISEDSTVAQADWTKTFDDRIAAEAGPLSSEPLSHGLDQAEADAIVASMRVEFGAELAALMTGPDNAVPSDFESLAELGLWKVIKEPELHLSTTGMVIAGYGDHDVFPSHVHYVSSGLIAGKHLAREVARQAITHSNPADLSAFAQKGMIDTFQLGLDVSVYSDAVEAIDDGLADFAAVVATASGGDLTSVADLPALKAAARSKITGQWLGEARKKHALPLRRVLASLPIPEMAELAETLVNLQSLKEKVTKPSQEVGGPIDVAVITRSEGLIWIKRKHFFDASINPRYMARLSGLYR